MDLNRFRKQIYGDLERKAVDEELQRRYKSRNLFRPDAGPPDPEVLRRVRGLRKIESEEQDRAVIAHKDKLTQPGEISDIAQAAPDFEIKPVEAENIAKLVMPRSREYVKGDNIFLDLLSYFKCNKLDGLTVSPVLEEDPNCVLAAVAASSKLSLIIEGKSRSGKSLILDKLCRLLTSVYQLKVCSNKALFGSCDDINNNDFLYVAEFQAVTEKNPAVKEVFKLLSEGKDATNDANGVRQTLSGKIAILSTGADENRRTQQRDVELSGRFVTLQTVPSPDKIRRICDYQDGLLMGTVPDVDFPSSCFDRLKAHFSSTINDVSSFENPFAAGFAEYLPETQKSVHYRTLYNSLVNGFARFDRHNRLRKSGKIVIGIADVYLVHLLYHKAYCDALEKLAVQSFFAVEKQLNEVDREVKKKELETELHLIDSVRSKPVDWQKIWDSGHSHMKERNLCLVGEWVGLQSRDGRVVVYDPVSRSDVYLAGIE